MSDDICAICQQAFDNEVRPGLSHDKVALPCFESHVFGRPCIVAWFDNGHLWCPLCTKKVSEEFAAGLDNRTYFQRMIDAATRTGIAIWNIAKNTILFSEPFINISLISFTTANSYRDLGPLALYNSIGALVTGVVGGIVLGGCVKIGHLPLIRVIPHGELIVRLAQIAGAFGGLEIQLRRHRNYPPPLAFLGLSQTVTNGVFGFGFGLDIADLVTRRLGEAV
ncbi:E3 ubiquitin protein ligase [Endozoicomonas euniceicola]|uniref:E3 ubiquitin protein ligase n=1 Tax=Endozoicomonas euniceicola TaxID=1234143 RepID=A0ABY6GPQ3_9GAMM|nr:E3 ubiquitin protein ligase [Endozoicomonas euniceicola]UYM14729.1 E3 ubiquitin protein ligase [Endozoicomonas euniceicola]